MEVPPTKYLIIIINIIVTVEARWVVPVFFPPHHLAPRIPLGGDPLPLLLMKLSEGIHLLRPLLGELGDLVNGQGQHPCSTAQAVHRPGHLPNNRVVLPQRADRIITPLLHSQGEAPTRHMAPQGLHLLVNYPKYMEGYPLNRGYFPRPIGILLPPLGLHPSSPPHPLEGPHSIKGPLPPHPEDLLGHLLPL